MNSIAPFARRGFPVLLLLFCGAGIFGVLDAQKRYPTAAEMRGHLQKGKCADCHKDIFKEWSESGHAKAWTSELYRALRTKYQPERNCDPCHAPQPLQLTGVGQMPRLRSDERERGVDCLTCHLAADGAMRGPFGDPSPFHRVQKEPALYTAEIHLCESCHGQKTVPAHNQVEDWLKSDAGRQRKTCQSCHMPETPRKPSRYSRAEKRTGAHTWGGSRSPEQLKDTLLLDADTTEKGVQVYLTNAAGHSIPAAPLREIRLIMTLKDERDRTLALKSETFAHPLGVDGKPVKPGVTDNRPESGETRTFLLPAKASAVPGSSLTALAQYRRAPNAPWMTMATLNARF